MRYTLEHAVVP